eukprot:4817762-Pleurochrysis_carterae.AAC.1
MAPVSRVQRVPHCFHRALRIVDLSGRRLQCGRLHPSCVSAHTIHLQRRRFSRDIASPDLDRMAGRIRPSSHLRRSPLR